MYTSNIEIASICVLVVDIDVHIEYRNRIDNVFGHQYRIELDYRSISNTTVDPILRFNR